MRRSSKPDAFFLVIRDDEAQRFTVAGPMTDDRPYVDAVRALQNSGRKVKCFTAPPSHARDEIARDYAAQSGFEYTTEPIV